MERAETEARTRADQWAAKARLAVEKGRDGLAREALLERRRYAERADALARELGECSDLVEQYQNDIMQLEDKLAGAREKQRVLVQRHIHARRKRRAEEEIRRIDTTDAFVRFEQFENRIERMEAEAHLVNVSRKPSLEEEFAQLEGDEELEEELQALKDECRGAESSTD